MIDNEEIKESLYKIEYAIDNLKEKLEVAPELNDFLLNLSVDDELPAYIREKAHKIYMSS